jgi:TRAP transporter TAXI family solute receptor
MAVKDVVRHNWPTITIIVTTLVILGAAVVMLLGLPPHTIVMATGPEGGAYYEIGKRYRAELARANVEVRLVPTAGSRENLALLRDPRSGVSIALLQGGTIGTADSAGLDSLGTVFYEPLWWFHRRDVPGGGLDGLRGRRISIGPEGSGTRALALELIKRADLEGQIGEVLALPPQTAADKLLNGEIDAAFVMASWESSVVQQLLADDRVKLSDIPRADAFVALYSFLHKVVVPRGVRDIAKDQPPNDVTLIAAKASIVARADLHPAIQYLLLKAASQIHAGSSIFHRANEFPAAEATDVPLSNEALRFYKSGLPFLHNYLPFWIAVLIGKLSILLIPIVGVLYPMTRLLPRTYDWLMRSKVFGLYGELRLLDDQIRRARASGQDTHEMEARLDELERHANHLRMPLAYASMQYLLRDHIELVREGLRHRADKPAE